MKKALLFVIVLLVGGWVVFAVLANQARGQDIVLTNSQHQTVNQANDQAARQDVQQEANQGNDQAPAIQAPAAETVLSLPAAEAAQLRQFADGLHTFTAALTLDSVIKRCADNLTFCGELQLLHAFALQAPASYGQVGSPAELVKVIDQVGEAFKTKDRGKIESGLNGLIAVTNNLASAVNGMVNTP